MGRNLKVLRIDDETVSRKYTTDYNDLVGDGFIAAPLEVVTFGTENDLRLRITDLSAAVLFWTDFESRRLPDIVLADVNFEKDSTSPLRDWNPSVRDIPTGLSHCKPFAAVARALGSPLAVVLFTGNNRQWKNLIAQALLTGRSDAQARESSVFGYLAAHEIMELAAILGDNIDGASRTNLEPVWRWLSDRTQSNPAAALSVALPDYRRQVVERLRRWSRLRDPLALRVPLGDRHRLLKWCLSMAQSPGLLKPDMDLPLLYADGRIDRINFVSLFFDAKDHFPRALPPECFDLRKHTGSIWDLDGGYPRIGAIIAEIGELDEAATAAQEALKFFPLGGQSAPEINLRDIRGLSVYARGVAILFQALGIYKEQEQKWQSIWHDRLWDPRTLSETTDAYDYDKTYPLGQWVELTRTAFQGAVDDQLSPEGFIELDEIAELLSPGIFDPDEKETTVEKYLDFLCTFDLLERATDRQFGVKYRIGAAMPAKGKVECPPLPSSEDALESLGAVLRESLGFDNNDAAVGQMLYSAFLVPYEEKRPVDANEKGVIGRKFLNEFENGEAPGWLVEICRTYCVDQLGWADQRSWPKCIRRSGLAD